MDAERRLFFEMQNIQLLTYGKLKEPYLRAAYTEYEKRLSRFCRLQCTELEPVLLPEHPSEKEITAALEKEAQPFLKRKKGMTVALCIEGKQMTSPQFAGLLQRSAMEDSSMTFFIGSSYGLAEEVKRAADVRLSFSAMTFPHQLFRILLLEQLYRGYQILGGSPYHK